MKRQVEQTNNDQVAAGDAGLPLAGLRVLDFGHMVMGPSCGLILADMGAEVIRIEPLKGDPTRNLTGFASGFFGFFNRNKRSIAIDLKHERGMEVAHSLIRSADVLLENFGPGTMNRLGLGWPEVHAINERVVYCQLKGYLKGPYENHMALDEVVQMQGGLAYMTGPKGTPLRAGASVVDIGGGMFGAIAILGALHERARTGRGALVQSALFETTAFFVGQHMASSAITGKAAEPMPSWRAAARPGDEPSSGEVSTWSVYQTFPTADGAAFIAVTSEQQWARFCESFELQHIASDERFSEPAARRRNRPQMLEMVASLMSRMSTAEVVARGRAARVSAAPVGRPDDLFDDPHLNAHGGMAETELRGGKRARMPVLPISHNEARFGLRSQPPESGADTQQVLASLGYDDAQIASLRAAGAVA